MGSGVRPTIYDVAEQAKVSISTVSKTLNTPHKVAEATRQRVLDAIQTTGFRPRSDASRRATKALRSIGAIAPFSTHLSFSERLNGILRECTAHGIDVTVFDVISDEESNSILETLPALDSVDALIIMGVKFSDRVAESLLDRIPTVLVDTTHEGLPSLSIDDEIGGVIAGRHLVENGRERLAYVGMAQSREDFDSASLKRQRGFTKALAINGAELPDESVLIVGKDFEESLHEIEEFLSGGRFDGVFAATDRIAATCLAAATNLGIAVPDELAVIGYDDGPIAELIELTTIHQPLRATGEWAVRSLLSRFEDPDALVPSLTMPVKLVQRRTA